MTHSFAQDTAGGMGMCMIVGAVLLFHGARVYTGRKRVAFRETHTVRGDIRRPDIDLAAAGPEPAWCSSEPQDCPPSCRRGR